MGKCPGRGTPGKFAPTAWICWRAAFRTVGFRRPIICRKCANCVDGCARKLSLAFARQLACEAMNAHCVSAYSLLLTFNLVGRMHRLARHRFR